MFRPGTFLTRAAVYLAVFVYALVPGVALAQCSCPGCPCLVEQDVQDCCCSAEEGLHVCCEAGRESCEAELVRCRCEPTFNGREPAAQVQRAEQSEMQIDIASAAHPFALVAAVQSELKPTIADLDPAACAPPIHLLNCVWRN